MKKIIALSLTLIFAVCVFSACGCAMNNNGATDNPTESATPTDNGTNNTDGNSTMDDAMDDIENGIDDAVDDVKDTAEDVKDNVTGKTQNSLPEVSENKEVIEDSKAPKIFMIEGADSTVDNVTYHLEGCKTCEGKKVTEIPWEMAKMVGFWQCPECNPPRYEGYKNAE